MTRLNATDRLRRLLAVIPWVSGRGEVSLVEISERFDYPVDRLRRDLTEVVQFVGVYPYTPDMLIEVYLDDDNDRVRFDLADYFTSPLQLTPHEALSLVSAGMGLLASTEGENSALERGLAKIANRLGVSIGDQLDVSLGGAAPAVVDEVRAAIETTRRLSIRYHSLHSDTTRTRLVDPHTVFSESGEWYLRAFCHDVREIRTFRLDRILEIETTTEQFEASELPQARTFAPNADDIRVVLDLAPVASWVAEAYPVESTSASDAGVRVTLAVSSTTWLARLLVQLGDAAHVVSSDPPLDADLRTSAARAVLERYR